MVPAPLLLVEDDIQLAEMLGELLTDAGYAVDTARDGQRGLHLALTRTYTVMVVDRGLPAIEGADLVRRLRDRGVATPILLLTALGTLADRVEGLDAGAEDYLVKPFEVDELLARLRALVRRHASAAGTVGLGDRVLDLHSRRVLGGGADPVELSGRECELLRVLAAQPRRTFSRDDLLARIFPDADGTGVVDTYVYYLRRKLGTGVVQTVHGVGYRMGRA
ncbi:response regulator transcription factor [Hamadaea tsunoensis]|uniref:response regulator transcription factor n=1 Tax=Hamadaea tsunoensis TaxID=53368 RepID=UPI00041D8C05|nr:response regulator transcription factor [Hamadaea tsunoensis]